MNILDSDIIDSRDIIDRIEELESEDELTNLETEELNNLLVFQEECQYSPDWSYGETIIREDYFTDYIKELIDDCFPIPSELNSGEWPWRHMYLDYEAAAEEAKQDYIEFSGPNYNYFIRA